SDVVRSVNHGRTAATGADTTIRSLGGPSWQRRADESTVVLHFEVSAPGRVVNLQVSAIATESKNWGRPWGILMKGTRTTVLREEPLAERLVELNASARAFAEAWLQKLAEGRGEEAYRETLPPEQRQAAADGYREFQRGGLLHADPERLWAEGALREEIP